MKQQLTAPAARLGGYAARVERLHACHVLLVAWEEDKRQALAFCIAEGQLSFRAIKRAPVLPPDQILRVRVIGDGVLPDDAHDVAGAERSLVAALLHAQFETVLVGLVAVA